MITYNDILPGDSRSAGQLNTILTKIANESAALGADNLAEGGLDHENFATNVVLADFVAKAQLVSVENDPTRFNNTVMAVPSFTTGPVALQLDWTAAHLVVTGTQRLRVYALLELETTGGHYGIEPLTTVEVELAVDTGAGYAVATGSYAKLAISGANGTVGSHGVLCTFIELGAGNYTKIGLRSRVVGAAGVHYQARGGIIHATLHQNTL